MRVTACHRGTTLPLRLDGSTTTLPREKTRTTTQPVMQSAIQNSASPIIFSDEFAHRCPAVQPARPRACTTRRRWPTA